MCVNRNPMRGSGGVCWLLCPAVASAGLGVMLPCLTDLMSGALFITDPGPVVPACLLGRVCVLNVLLLSDYCAGILAITSSLTCGIIPPGNICSRQVLKNSDMFRVCTWPSILDTCFNIMSTGAYMCNAIRIGSVHLPMRPSYLYCENTMISDGG
ncbi:hypothetical protein F4861DRAFT_524118 [Xylaria intraflava]|nr:hypothetical protein F4861DRAFT_524118 [Xylaria intraflava]